MKARVVRFEKTGGPDVLKVEEIDVPRPAHGEIRIRVHALGLNRAEAMFRGGTYLQEYIWPSRIGYEAAGEVEALGDGVSGFSIGDAVSVLPGFSLSRYGTDGELATLPAENVVHNPANLSWNEAASIWMQYVTAYGALIDIAGLKSGDFVLIPAASSSVGIAAIQIANMVGAKPIALTRASVKREKLLELGSAGVVVTTQQNISKEVDLMTAGEGARVIFDPVGGARANDLLKAASNFGIYFIYGALDLNPISLDPVTVLGKGLTIRGYQLMEVVHDPRRRAKAIEFITGGLAGGKLKPVIAKTFALEQIADAHRYLESNEQVGKIVITV